MLKNCNKKYLLFEIAWFLPFLNGKDFCHLQTWKNVLVSYGLKAIFKACCNKKISQISKWKKFCHLKWKIFSYDSENLFWFIFIFAFLEFLNLDDISYIIKKSLLQAWVPTKAHLILKHFSAYTYAKDSVRNSKFGIWQICIYRGAAH